MTLGWISGFCHWKEANSKSLLTSSAHFSSDLYNLCNVVCWYFNFLSLFCMNPVSAPNMYSTILYGWICMCPFHLNITYLWWQHRFYYINSIDIANIYVDYIDIYVGWKGPISMSMYRWKGHKCVKWVLWTFLKY